MSATLEYLVAEVLELAGNCSKYDHRSAPEVNSFDLNDVFVQVHEEETNHSSPHSGFELLDILLSGSVETEILNEGAQTF